MSWLRLVVPLPLILATAALFAYCGSTTSISATHRPDGAPLFGVCIVLVFAIQWLAFIPSALLNTEMHYDLTGGLTYFFIIVFSSLMRIFGDHDHPLAWSTIVIALLVSVWALRISTFLYDRIQNDGFDRRFAKIKEDPWRLFLVWNLQALWITVTSSAALTAICAIDHSAGWDLFTLVGALLWTIGFTLETIADAQKREFRFNRFKTRPFITTGLWARAQHPNYFGEMLLWLGIALMALPHLHTNPARLSLVSPVFVFLLLTRLSGIPLLQASAERRWGRDPAYRHYVRTTPLLIPKLFL